MHELREDVISRDDEEEQDLEIDEKVVAPTEPLDDRDSEEPEFRVNEELSSTNTNYGTFNDGL